MSGRHRNNEPVEIPRRQPRRGRIAAAVGSGVLLLGVGVGAWAVMEPGNCTELPLNVVATPEIAPVLTNLAKDAGTCPAIAVQVKNSADEADALAGGQTAPDVWVPEASIWVDLARAQGAQRLGDPETPSIARSPVIMALPQALATKVAVGGGTPTWSVLIPSDRVTSGNELTVMLPDPRRHAAGIAVVNLFNAAMQDRGDLMTVMAQILPDLKRSLLPTQDALFAILDNPPAKTRPMIVATEQSVWAHNREHPSSLAVGVYPPEGAASLDFPYTVTTKDPERKRRALEFRNAVTSANGVNLLKAAGFRGPDGRGGPNFSDQYGVRLDEPKRIPAPPTETTTRVLLALRLLLADTRALLLIDVSGSMKEIVPGTHQTRMAATARLAEEGVDKLPTGSDVGLWIFSTHLGDGKDYKQLVPMGPLEERKDDVVAQLRGLSKRVQGDTGLYDSVLAAFDEASKLHNPDKVSTVVVFTDGKNDDPDGGIGLDELLDHIKAKFRPDHPVVIAPIGFGDGVDASELRKIAAATNGKAYVTSDLSAARQIFLDVIARRVCMIRCPG
ncbi:VWA domain-containing protein [Streptosporangiaceae bacterium NEAU-GS5]|nr:VWA domain-containing protein [Streptosporangiaceae bacterium NEAU-GS5]